PDIDTLSLHDALPIWKALKQELAAIADKYAAGGPQEAKQTTIITTLWNRFKINSLVAASVAIIAVFSTLWLSGYYKTIETTTSRSEEHTSELQSRENL